MKILYFIRALNIGGAETFIYNTLENISEEYHIDFVLQSYDSTNINLIELCKKRNSKIFYIIPFYKNYIKSIKQLYEILKKEKYDLIHIHANALINIVPVIAAKLVGTKIAIHSHNTKNNKGGFLGYILHKISSYFINKMDIIRFACGYEAGEWMYGKKISSF